MGWASVGVQDLGGAAAGQSIVSTFANTQLDVDLQGPVGPASTLVLGAGGTWGVVASAGHDPAVPKHVACYAVPPPASPGMAGDRRRPRLQLQGWMKQPPGFYSPILNRWALHEQGFVACSQAFQRRSTTEAGMEIWVRSASKSDRVGRHGAGQGAHAPPRAARKGPEVTFSSVAGHGDLSGALRHFFGDLSVPASMAPLACAASVCLSHSPRTRQDLCWRSVSEKPEAAVTAGSRQRESSQAE